MRNYMEFLIVLVLIMGTKGIVHHAYLSTFNTTWKEANTMCTLIGSNNLYNLSNYKMEKGWINETAYYSPWYEYLGCYGLKNRSLIKQEGNVPSGRQLSECSRICKEYFFIGLQETRCVCLQNISVNFGYLNNSCYNDQSSTCIEERNTFFCAITNAEFRFSLYRRVDIKENISRHNCLSVSQQFGVYMYMAQDCENRLSQICSNPLNRRDPAAVTYGEKKWSESCLKNSLRKFLEPYSEFEETSIRLGPDRYYWLGNTRRPIFHTDVFLNTEPEYCVAATVDKFNRVTRTIEDCSEQLPSLCSGIKSNEMLDNSNDASGILSKNGILIIVVAVVGVLAFGMAIVVTVLFIRYKRNGQRQEHHLVPNTDNEVVYAQVNKPAKSQVQNTEGGKETETETPSTSNDIYDHMNHGRREENQADNNYDTMKCIETEDENTYNFTNEKDVDNTFVDTDNDGYGHLEAEYHEIGKIP